MMVAHGVVYRIGGFEGGMSDRAGRIIDFGVSGWFLHVLVLCVFGIKWIKVARFWALFVFFGLFGVFLRASFWGIWWGFWIF